MLKYSHRCPVGNCCKQLPSVAAYTAATARTTKPSLLEGSGAHRAPVRPRRFQNPGLHSPETTVGLQPHRAF